MLRDAADAEGDATAALEPRPTTAPQRPGFRAVDEIDILAAATEPYIMLGDARNLPLQDNSVDLIVTSPPYFNKRNYDVQGQIGLEKTPAEYVESMMQCLRDWRRVLRPFGSIFLNLGDSFYKKSLVNIPGRTEAAAADEGWLIRNRIIWAKTGGMPEAVQNRLAGRHEYIIHLAQNDRYHYDLHAYSTRFGNGANPGDVWQMNPERNMGRHLAPFPSELVQRAITLACPDAVCRTCGEPRRRQWERTAELDPSRPQARRAMELAKQYRLTEAHFAAIRATGVSDAGKAQRTQTGTGRNSRAVQILAAEAKAVLGGYFREFTFGKRRTTGFTDCGHGDMRPGVVLDPFMGTGTSVRVACEMGRTGIGVDLYPHWP